MPDPASTSPCIVFGIPNCDTVKKARNWLDGHGHDYRFHDFRRDGITADLLRPWLNTVGWETLVNRKGTSWRKVPEEQRPSDETGAIALMLATPSVIKRPVLMARGQILVGFSETAWSSLFA
jgi:arsenate reductase